MYSVIILPFLSADTEGQVGVSTYNSLFTVRDNITSDVRRVVRGDDIQGIGVS